MENPCVYILEGKDGRYYVGSTNKLEERMKQHQGGQVTSTRKFQPLVLKVFIECQNSREARQAELHLKRYKSKKILGKVISDRIFPWNFPGA